MMRSLDVRIHNDVAELPLARDALDGLGNELGIPAHTLMQLQVALDEIASNVIKYSWDDGARHEFMVRISVLADRVELEFVDDGRAFDPLSARPPETPPAGGRPRPGGLDIHLVTKLVDQFSYERMDGLNHTKISKLCKIGAAVQEVGK